MAPIEPIPLSLPPDVKDAVSRGQLVVFVGAGASRLLGCAGWDELARSLISACHETGYITFKEMETLAREPDHRKSISICHYIIAKKNKNPRLFSKYLKKALKPKKALVRDIPIYKELYDLGAIFVTTNADDLFDKLFIKQAVIYHPEDFPKDLFDRTKLYHLHGTIHDDKSWVFSVDEYIRHYRRDQVQGFLRKLFSDYTVLFVGYGLEELQLLEYLIITNNRNNGIARHFYLMPMYEGEDHLLEFQQAYFQKLGINVIAYDISKYGYQQLYEVIKRWRTEIRLTTSSLVATLGIIEQAVASCDEATVTRVLQLIKNDATVRDHFFKHVSLPCWLTPLADAGYFDPSKNRSPVSIPDNPGYVSVPYWNVLQYLEKVATRIASDDKASSSSFLQIVRNIADYRNTEGKRIQNYRTDWAITKIFATVPVRFLEASDIGRVSLFLSSSSRSPVDSEVCVSLLPHVLAAGNKRLTAKLFAVMMSHEWENQRGSDKAVPMIEEYWLDEILKKHLPAIAKLIPLEAARTAIRAIEDIVGHDTYAFHVIAMPSIEALSQENFPDRYELLLVVTASQSLAESVEHFPTEAKSIVRRLLRRKYKVLKRLALDVIARKWETLAEAFWQFASVDLLTDPFVIREVRSIARKNFDGFTAAQKSTWLDWIDGAPYYVPDDISADPDKREKYLTTWKLRHLAPIKHSRFPRVAELYQQYIGVLGEYFEDEEDVVISGPVSVDSEADSRAAQLLKLSVTEILKSMEAQPRDENSWKRAETEAAFQKAVEVAPEKFLAELRIFVSAARQHQLTVLRGLKTAWDSGKHFERRPVLEFCRTLVSSEPFWRKDQGKSVSVQHQIILQIADLIIAGTGSDAAGFPEDNLHIVEEILLTLIKRAPSDLEGTRDLVFEVANSSRGRVMLAAISYSIFVARLKKDQPGGQQWPAALRHEFNRRLKRTNDNTLEFSFALGEYLRYLYSLDKPWVEQNINRIFPKGDERHWKAAFSGYLTQPSVYNEFYDLLRSHNHYEKALRTALDSKLNERLTHHICFGYLRDVEKLEDSNSLIRNLIDSWDLKILNDIVMFFWIRRKDAQPSDIQKTLALWDVVASHYDSKPDLTGEEKELLSHTARLSMYLESVDPQGMRLLLLSAKHVDKGHNTPIFVENLDRLAGVSPRQVAKVYVEMLQNEICPDYEVKHIVSCVEKIYAAGQKDLGNTICNLYLQRGHEFLRELFDRNNKVSI